MSHFREADAGVLIDQAKDLIYTVIHDYWCDYSYMSQTFAVVCECESMNTVS